MGSVYAESLYYISGCTAFSCTERHLIYDAY